MHSLGQYTTPRNYTARRSGEYQISRIDMIFLKKRLRISTSTTTLLGTNILDKYDIKNASTRYEYLWQDGNKKLEKVSAPEWAVSFSQNIKKITICLCIFLVYKMSQIYFFIKCHKIWTEYAKFWHKLQRPPSVMPCPDNTFVLDMWFVSWNGSTIW